MPAWHRRRFLPARFLFPLLHIDTSYKFPRMIEFRDAYAREIGAQLIVHKNQEALDAGANPFSLGTQKCCGLLKPNRCLMLSLKEALTLRSAAPAG